MYSTDRGNMASESQLLKYQLGALVIAIVFSLLLQMPTAAADTCPSGNGWHKIEWVDGDLMLAFDAGSGNIVTQVCVKGGQNLIFFHEDGEDMCFLVEGIGTQIVLVEEDFLSQQSPKCKDISHTSFLVETLSTATHTPSATPTATHTPLATPGVTHTPLATPTATHTPLATPGVIDHIIYLPIIYVQPTPTPTATHTPTPTITPTPTPTPTPANIPTVELVVCGDPYIYFLAPDDSNLDIKELVVTAPHCRAQVLFETASDFVAVGGDGIQVWAITRQQDGIEWIYAAQIESEYGVTEIRNLGQSGIHEGKGWPGDIQITGQENLPNAIKLYEIRYNRHQAVVLVGDRWIMAMSQETMGGFWPARLHLKYWREGLTGRLIEVTH